MSFVFASIHAGRPTTGRTTRVRTKTVGMSTDIRFLIHFGSPEHRCACALLLSLTRLRQRRRHFQNGMEPNSIRRRRRRMLGCVACARKTLIFMLL